MRFMNLFSIFTRKSATLLRLPSGGFTVDRDGQILISTLPQTFPKNLVNDIAARVLKAFKSSHAAQLPLSELIVHYPSLKVTARELRGGAIVFLSPQSLSNTQNSITLEAYAR